MHEGRCHLSNEGYSVSKRVLEILVRFYREKYNYEWICIIPTNIYGKYDNFNLDNSHVIPSIIHKMYLAKENNTNVKLMGDGTAVRQFIYNRDFDKTKDNGIHKKTSSNGKLMKILDKSFSFTDINEGLKETIDWFIREYENIRK
ncbi:GDP-L-fucose synthase, putative (FS) [Plasmodium malariae]|uniref:GDP-L-fucose synthase, putative (FS) n=1 Tax=Plasmodium malariae TaxID=5858 RepID=A0A1A8WSF1_PLAMA|nr:GDP-L-fucose synthase, putative (FS) [Plasmodium malariae]